ncbi:hypothetical protein RM780_04495 [Streptomyces sp. DSM 44917]|uniref:Orc1-like AAA ATPase domain-containing protein n=1 Tax=Streptomyces boetiae TaxID=3075541 RepID=A0ABU2L476_9ACTN|nr:hypothetical protein [Streptomyces sp. DSM 44917]MDT0306221.1 hypothetical protein [Streptomyces sp. DSM 44917]
MTGDRPPVFERQTVIRRVHALAQPGYPLPGGERRPVVYVQGGRGYGKTLLLDLLEDWVSQYLPSGRADFADGRHEELPHLLSVLAGQLTRYRPGYGRLRFPRLLIALLALEEDLRPYRFDEARLRLSEALKQRRNGMWPQRFLGELTEQPPEVQVQVPFVIALVRLPVNALVALVGFTFPGRAQRWFGHRDKGLPHKPLDTLIELNRWAHTAREDPSGPAGREAGERMAGLLCEAFLADLRDSPRRVRARQTPLLLLDNADAPAGRDFLRWLIESRPALGEGDRAEPLTVVATGREPLPEMADGRVAEAETAAPDAETAAPDAAGRAAGRAGGTGRAGAPVWLRYRLPDLTRPDIQRLLDDAAGGERVDRRLTRLVHEFTAGHPQAAGLLAEVAARRAGRGGSSGAPESVAALLTCPAPQGHGRGAAGAGGPWGAGPAADGPRAAGPGRGDPHAGEGGARARSAEEWLLARLLPVEESGVAAFARCAAARTEADGLWLSHQPDLVAAPWGQRVRQAAPWRASGDAGTAVLRRLLLRRLAAAPGDGRGGGPDDGPGEGPGGGPGGGPGWEAVHGRLRDQCRANGDLAGELHHALALGELAGVAERLAALLPRTPGREWLALLRAAAGVPLGAEAAAPSPPYELFERLVRDAVGEGADDTVTRVVHVVAALRIVRDPLTGLRRRLLYDQIATALGVLAAAQPRDGLVLLQEAVTEYREQAAWWA